MLHEKIDTVIIGNGILAYATAFSLARKDKEQRIAIIGQKSKKGNASIAAGAMLACFAEVERDALQVDINRYKFDLSRRSAEMWPQWAENIHSIVGKKIFDIHYGTYVIHNAKADELDDESFDGILETLKEYQEPHELVTPKTIPGYQPGRLGRALRAVYIKREGFIDSWKLAHAYESALRMFPNIHLVDDNAENVLLSDGGGGTVLLGTGKTISGRNIVIACGSGTQKLIEKIEEIKEKIPKIFHGIGAGVLVRNDGIDLKNTIRTANRGLACGVHAVPREDNHIFLGASNFISPVPEYSPRMSSLYTLLRSAMDELHYRFYKCQVEHVIVGHRPTTADTFPVIGQTSVDGLWILSGTKRDGIHTSPLWGSYMAGCLLGDGELFENRFKPERKLLFTMSRKEGIAKAVKHLKSAGYQHDLELPKSGWEPMIDDMLRRKVEEVYDKIQNKDIGIPPEMLDMYRYGHVAL